MPDFFTVEQIAKMLKMSPQTIRRAIASGKLAAHDVGLGHHRHHWRIAAVDLTTWLETRKATL